MTTGGIIAVAVLLVMLALVLRGIRGHGGYSDRDHHGSWHSGDSGGD